MSEMSRSPMVKASRSELPGFESIEAAVEFYFREDLSLMGNEIIRFEKEQHVLVVFSGGVKRFINSTPSIFLFLLEKGIDDNYYFLNMWTQGIYALFYDNSGRWHEEDRVARDIVLAYTRKKDTILVNSGIPLYYGVGVGEPPFQLYVMGGEPDAIVSFEYRGENYYFWYYRKEYHFGDVLEYNIDIQAFTLAEIIALFDIQFIR